jgi:hypothetical protein
MIIGFDLDGVIRKVNMGILRCMHRLSDIKGDLELYNWYYGCLEPPILDPRTYLGNGDKAIILTAQPTYAMELTKKYLAKWLPDIPYEMYEFKPVSEKQWDKLANQGVSKTTNGWADWKAERILDLGIEIFIDDGPDIVKVLREKVGDKCKVIQYGGRFI